MIGVEDLAGTLDVGGVLGTRVPRQVEDGVEPGAYPPGLRRLVTGALELAHLAQCGFAYLLGQVGLVDARPVVVGTLGLVLTEFLADGGELLTEQELLLLLVHPRANVLGDLLADLGLGEMVAGPFDQQPQPCGGVRRLEEFALLLVGEPGRVARRVGEARRIGHLVDGVDQLPRLAALQHRQNELLVLAGQGPHLVGDLGVGDLGGLDPQRSAVAGCPGPDLRTLLTLDDGGETAARDAPDLNDRRDDPVRGVPVVQTWGDQQFSGLARPRSIDGGLSCIVEPDRHDHAGQDDDVRDEEDRQ